MSSPAATAAPEEPAAEIAGPADCKAGLTFTDPYRVASNNTVRAGFRLTSNCGGKASIGFWVEGPVANAWEEFRNFPPGGGGYGVNYKVGRCRPGTYRAYATVLFSAADGTAVELRRNSNKVKISC
ncbi:hypothetical protein [Kribbella amoyensis]|uniref:hypothetical protein n=1 Tax=Kribbella amoyensis TaxID=996641 RepID=UPI0011A9D4CB|nr:hypothetical protein [Kribbella amoyensis]